MGKTSDDPLGMFPGWVHIRLSAMGLAHRQVPTYVAVPCMTLSLIWQRVRHDRVESRDEDEGHVTEQQVHLFRASQGQNSVNNTSFRKSHSLKVILRGLRLSNSIKLSQKVFLWPTFESGTARIFCSAISLRSGWKWCLGFCEISSRRARSWASAHRVT